MPIDDDGGGGEEFSDLGDPTLGTPASTTVVPQQPSATQVVQQQPQAPQPQPYNPVGALGDLFAPAFIRGNPQSEQAVMDWTARQRPVTPAMVDQLRIPSTAAAGTLSFGDPRGMVDINALRAVSQGGPYDAGARRDAIAQQIMAQSSAQIAAAQEQAAANRFGVKGGRT